MSKKEKTIDEIMSLMSECPFPAVGDDFLNNGARYLELSNEEIEKRANIIAMKAEEKGLCALDPEEREYYKYYLFKRAYKLNSKGEAVKPIHASIADLVLCDLRIFILYNDLYIYDPRDGAYKLDNDAQELRHRIRSFLNREFVEDKTICSICSLILNDRRFNIGADRINNRPKHWIHFKNGYYDLKTDVIRPHNPDYNEIGVIPWEYSPGRYPGNYKYVEKGKGLLKEAVESPLIFDTWIEKAIPDYNDRIMLYQYIAYAMTLRTDEQKFLLICGPGGTGKSTLLKLIEEILGRANVSGISLQGLQERFAPAGLFLKQANICADIPLSALNEVDMIKKLTGEDTVSADRKFKSPFSFRSYARLFFSANSIPYIDEKTNAFYRRMLILKMVNVPDTIDRDLFEKLRAEIPNIITKITEELYCSSGAIDISENCKESVKTAQKESDSVVAFLDDRCESDPDTRVDRRTLYDAYKNYCFTEGRKELTPNGFYKALNNKGFVQVKGKTRDIIGLKITTVISFPNVANR